MFETYCNSCSMNTPHREHRGKEACTSCGTEKTFLDRFRENEGQMALDTARNDLEDEGMRLAPTPQIFPNFPRSNR